jgi:cobalamin biosynthesis protein CobD/CbiB
MNQIIHNYVAFEFAGLLPLLLEYGIGTLLIAGCLALAYFSPILKKDFLYAAGVLAIVMVTFTIGVSNGEKRIQAQWDTARANAVGDAKQARVKAVHSVARKPSRWLPNRKDPDIRDGQ